MIEVVHHRYGVIFLATEVFGDAWHQRPEDAEKRRVEHEAKRGPSKRRKTKLAHRVQAPLVNGRPRPLTVWCRDNATHNWNFVRISNEHAVLAFECEQDAVMFQLFAGGTRLALEERS